jgi:radical SAM-linked protein
VAITRPVSPHWFITAVNHQLPAGIEVTEVFAIGPAVPSLQSQVRSAIYQVEIETGKPQPEIEKDIDRLLALEHLPWHHERDTGRRDYDLRLLIEDVWVMECRNSTCVLGMELRCDETGSGRPEQVVLALGYGQPQSIHRTKLILNANR